MKTYYFKVNLGSRNSTIQVNAESYTEARNKVYGQFPASAIISPI
jgi:hypothetical protein